MLRGRFPAIRVAFGAPRGHVTSTWARCQEVEAA
jgi:hypothetical protein